MAIRLLPPAAVRNAWLELKEELGDNLVTLQLDVRNRAAIEEALASLPADWQQIDILVNNAGLALGMEPGIKPTSMTGKT